MKKISVIFLALTFVFSLSGCTMYKSTTTTKDGDLLPSAKKETNVFGKDFSVFCYGEKCEEASDAVLEELNRLDGILNADNSESELYKLNQNKQGEISNAMYLILNKAIMYNEETDGAFNILTLADNDMSKLEVTETGGKHIFKMGENQELNLEGIEEGYALGQAVDILKQYNIVSAEIYFEDCFVEYGNSANGEPWVYKVPKAFEDELETSGKIGDLKVSDKVICTAAAENVTSDLISVTIISTDGTLAHALSKACLEMGYEKTVEFWRENQDKFDMILSTTDSTIFATENIRRNFTSAYYNINLITNG